MRGRSSMVEPQSSKLATRVRFSSPAPQHTGSRRSLRRAPDHRPAPQAGPPPRRHPRPDPLLQGQRGPPGHRHRDEVQRQLQPAAPHLRPRPGRRTRAAARRCPRRSPSPRPARAARPGTSPGCRPPTPARACATRSPAGWPEHHRADDQDRGVEHDRDPGDERGEHHERHRGPVQLRVGAARLPTRVHTTASARVPPTDAGCRPRQSAAGIRRRRGGGRRQAFAPARKFTHASFIRSTWPGVNSFMQESCV